MRSAARMFPPNHQFRIGASQYYLAIHNADPRSVVEQLKHSIKNDPYATDLIAALVFHQLRAKDVEGARSTFRRLDVLLPTEQTAFMRKELKL